MYGWLSISNAQNNAIALNLEGPSHLYPPKPDFLCPSYFNCSDVTSYCSPLFYDIDHNLTFFGLTLASVTIDNNAPLQTKRWKTWQVYEPFCNLPAQKLDKEHWLVLNSIKRQDAAAQELHGILIGTTQEWKLHPTTSGTSQDVTSSTGKWQVKDYGWFEN